MFWFLVAFLMNVAFGKGKQSDSSEPTTDNETLRQPQSPQRKMPSPIAPPRESKLRSGKTYGDTSTERPSAPEGSDRRTETRDEPADVDTQGTSVEDPDDDLFEYVPLGRLEELSRRTGCRVDELREAARDLDRTIPIAPGEDRESRAGRLVQRALEMAKTAADKVNPFRMWEKWLKEPQETATETPTPIEDPSGRKSRARTRTKRVPSPRTSKAHKSLILGSGKAAADKSARFKDPPEDSFRSHGSHVPPPEHATGAYTRAELSNTAALAQMMNMLNQMSKGNERRDEVIRELARSVGTQDKELRDKLQQLGETVRNLSDNLGDDNLGDDRHRKLTLRRYNLPSWDDGEHSPSIPNYGSTSKRGLTERVIVRMSATPENKAPCLWAPRLV